VPLFYLKAQPRRHRQVSVFVIDSRHVGWLDPTVTSPTKAVAKVFLRVMRAGVLACAYIES
jgi:hypothetical protein